MTINWGIIGCGNVTEVKSGPGFQKAAGSRLVAVMRRSGDLAKDYAQRHGVARWYDDAEKLIADAEVNAVYIATPPGTHEAYALKVAVAGKPAYVEKPMARNRAECRRMIEAFERAGRPLFVAFYRRGLPRFVKARELAQSGALGTITNVSYRYADTRFDSLDPGNLPWRLVARESGGGVFLDLASHTLDILDYILGPIAQAQGMAANLVCPHDVEDAVAMSFRFDAGALGSASWNFASAVHDDLIEITGTKARLSLSCFGDEPLRLADRSGQTTTISLPNPPHVQQPLIQTITDQLLGKGTCPSTGVSGARTQKIMDDVLSAYYGGRDDAFWDRPATWPGRRV